MHVKSKQVLCPVMSFVRSSSLDSAISVFAYCLYVCGDQQNALLQECYLCSEVKNKAHCSGRMIEKCSEVR
jgi:hypothetical protein